ncbi:hypothetical protein LCGC14_1320840 [marine sediment metagenome]|uniref:Uncharacterized protein n=1 Tax=marine sediment metagenome TaxID=412755 RepID=A0A0F9KJM0_9ZZZZ
MSQPKKDQGGHTHVVPFVPNPVQKGFIESLEEISPMSSLRTARLLLGRNGLVA